MKPFVMLSAGLIVLSACHPRPEPVPADLNAPMAAEVIGPKIEQVDARQARALYEYRGDLVVLDLRTPTEYAKAHIPGALNFNHNAPDFAQKVNELDKNRLYLVHAGSETNLTTSLEVFNAEGFQKIFHLEGGMPAWRLERNPVVPSAR